MNTRVGFVIIGAFVMLGAVLLTVFAIAFARATGGAGTARYVMSFEESVAGLTTGAAVRFMGVPVGQVEQFSLRAIHPPIVRVEASVRDDTPIDSFTVASIAYEGITGVAYVNLATSERTVDTRRAGAGPGRIATRPGALNSLVTSAPDIATATAEALSRLNRLLSDGNLAAVSGSIENLHDVLTTLEARRPDLGVAIAGMADASQRIDAAAGDLQRLIADAAPRVDSLTLASGELIERLDRLTQKNEAALDGFLGDGLGQVPDIAQSLTNALTDIERLTRKLSEDPSRVLYRARHDQVGLAP